MSSSCAPDACGCHGNPRFDGLDPRYKRVLWTVIAINAAMFLVEIIAGQLAGSQALQADALDFLGDTVTYGISLAVIGASLRTRTTAALLKGGSLTLMGLWVFGTTAYHVLILGLPKAEIIQLLTHALAFVCPSVYEPLGIVNLEAMACATAVVASRVGGIPEVVDGGVTGLLVPAEDPASLADALNMLLRDPGRADAMGCAGRERAVAEFSWDAVGAQTAALYAELVAT